MSDQRLGCLAKSLLIQNFYWAMSDLSKTLISHPGHIQAYSSIFSTLYNPRIFTVLSYFEPWHLEPWAYLKPCEALARHRIQNPAMGHYSVIFRHIQNLMQCLHMQKPGILGILEYSELFHNCIPTLSPPRPQRIFSL